MVAILEVVSQVNTLKQRPSGLVALFVGATSGIGLATLRVIAERLSGPRLYVVGRSKAKFESELARLKQLNDSAIITFIETEIVLLKNVDQVVVDALSKAESRLDLLYMSPGHLAFGGPHYTEEGLDICMSLSYYVRMRLVQCLRPLLLTSHNPRVLSVLAGGHERAFFTKDGDLGLRNPGNYNAPRAVDQLTTLHSLAFAHLTSLYPEISFLHVYPGWVATEFLSNLLGSAGIAGKLLEKVVHPLYLSIATTEEESGQRQAFHATSVRYPSREFIRTARIDINDCAVCHAPYSGFYLVASDGESANSNAFLKRLLDEGWAERVWEYTECVFEEVLTKQ